MFDIKLAMLRLLRLLIGLFRRLFSSRRDLLLDGPASAAGYFPRRCFLRVQRKVCPKADPARSSLQAAGMRHLDFIQPPNLTGTRPQCAL